MAMTHDPRSLRERLTDEVLTELHAYCAEFENAPTRSIADVRAHWNKLRDVLVAALTPAPSPAMSILGIPVRVEPSMPRDEVRFEDKHGNVVGAFKVADPVAPETPTPSPFETWLNEQYDHAVKVEEADARRAKKEGPAAHAISRARLSMLIDVVQAFHDHQRSHQPPTPPPGTAKLAAPWLEPDCPVCRRVVHAAWHKFAQCEINPIALLHVIQTTPVSPDAGPRIERYVRGVTGITANPLPKDEPLSAPPIPAATPQLTPTSSVSSDELDAIWRHIERGWDIEPRAFFESAESREAWPGHPLIRAIHHMWKRRVIEDALEPPAWRPATSDWEDLRRWLLNRYANETVNVLDVLRFMEGCEPERYTKTRNEREPYMATPAPVGAGETRWTRVEMLRKHRDILRDIGAPSSVLRAVDEAIVEGLRDQPAGETPRYRDSVDILRNPPKVPTLKEPR